MAFLVFISLLLLYGLVSHRLERTVITAPIVFCVAGILLGLEPSVVNRPLFTGDLLLRLAEVALVLILFNDASRIKLVVLRRYEHLPLRLLGIGMPLTIIFGAIVAAFLFPELSIWEAGIIGSILAPTDAGLGEVIVNSEQVPGRIRQYIFIESGLNDGLAVPFLMLFFDIAQEFNEGTTHRLFSFLLEQVGIGTIFGIIIGFAGGWLIDKAIKRGWMAKSFQQLSLMTLPILCMLASEPHGGSIFIAAFAAGIAIQKGYKDVDVNIVEFAKNWGQMLNLFVFFVFGLIAGPAVKDITWPFVLYAVLSLTVIRMIPVALSLSKTGLKRATVLFIGWFGPRGLASIVLGLIFFLKEAELPGEPIIKLVLISTILLSIFAHGLTALPGIHLYSKEVKKLDASAPELRKIPEHQELLTL
jgi:NhaP-type Na+/H+ or K+/H+ antiporter